MNALAAVHLYGGPAIVVDFGTPTNFDAVSERGEFLGGALAPGHRDLGRRAVPPGAQLRKSSWPGRGRRDRQEHRRGAAVRHHLTASPGQVEGIASRMAAELEPRTRTRSQMIATGGLAPLVIDEVAVIDAYEPWLTLIGLRLIYERNTADRPGADSSGADRAGADRPSADRSGADRAGAAGPGAMPR